MLALKNETQLSTNVDKRDRSQTKSFTDCKDSSKC